MERSATTVAALGSAVLALALTNSCRFACTANNSEDKTLRVRLSFRQ
jgi:hypothetical protein